MNKGNGHTHQPDLMAVGFHQLDDHLIEPNAPKISWGLRFKEMTPQAQIKYLMNLASAMNHAAYLIQNERNAINELCEQKELQIKSLNVAVIQNNEMLQTEITKMNAQRQSYNKEIARLNTKLRELGDGDID